MEGGAFRSAASGRKLAGRPCPAGSAGRLTRVARRRLATSVIVSLVLLLPAAEARAAGVFVVGDSLEVGTSPYLGRYLPGVPIHVDAVESRPSGDAVQALRAGLRPEAEQLT